MLFQRATDRRIKDDIGKQPLEVGADRIARTAHAALEILHDLRQRVGKPIPLAWSLGFEGVAVIEVYPGATLVGWGCSSTGYKKPTDVAARGWIANSLGGEVVGLSAVVDGPADVFDACLCLLAAKDFLDGRATPPRDHDLAIKEGWIWARGPQ
jgi:predicted nuclease with RNAse H fold